MNHTSARQKFWIGLNALAIFAAFGLVSPAFAFGDGRDSNKPIEYAADHSEVFREGRALLTGNVVLIQGDTRLKCDKLTLYFNNKDQTAKSKSAGAKQAAPAEPAGDVPNMGGLYRYDAEGSVFASSPDETASGDKAVFEVDKKLITMTGNVVLTRGKNVLRGSKLVIETETGRSRLDPESNGRVKGLFVPEDKADKPAKPQGGVK